jgi:hypothetical protein
LYYDNDGADSTRDTTFLIDYLPAGVAIVDTDTVGPGAGKAVTPVMIYSLYNGTWINHLPKLSISTTKPATMDSLFRIRALRFAIAPKIAAQNGTDNITSVTADDSSGTDAGLIRYRVRIK